MSKQSQKTANEQRREFLLTFFEKEDGYEEKEVNGWWLVKYWDGNCQRWSVSIYSQQSMSNLKRGQQKFRENRMKFFD